MNNLTMKDYWIKGIRQAAARNSGNRKHNPLSKFGRGLSVQKNVIIMYGIAVKRINGFRRGRPGDFRFVP